MAPLNNILNYLNQNSGAVPYYITILFLLVFVFIECLFVTRWISARMRPLELRKSRIEKSNEGLVWLAVPVFFLAFFFISFRGYPIRISKSELSPKVTVERTAKHIRKTSPVKSIRYEKSSR